MSKKLLFTIGADPELFLIAPNGKFISSIGKIGGTKEHPKDVGEGCAVQEDNVAVEFNIPPAQSFESFKNSLNYSLSVLQERAKSLNLKLAIEASAEFTPDQLTTPKSRQFGCDPDFNAWTLMENPRPKAVNSALRSCGGHVHVGTNLNIVDVIRAMDLFLGCPSTVMDKDNRRRELYGKAGAYRPTVYGGEYRTLSNFWLAADQLIEWVYNQTAFALRWVQNHTKENQMEWNKELAIDIQNCINNNDKDAYMKLDKEFNFGL